MSLLTLSEAKEPTLSKLSMEVFMETYEELKVRWRMQTDADSWKNHVHTQPLLLKIVIGDHKTDVISNYIRSPKFRASMKANSFGNLLGVFDSQEVTDLNNHKFLHSFTC